MKAVLTYTILVASAAFLFLAEQQPSSQAEALLPPQAPEVLQVSTGENPDPEPVIDVAQESAAQPDEPVEDLVSDVVERIEEIEQEDRAEALYRLARDVEGLAR